MSEDDIEVCVWTDYEYGDSFEEAGEPAYRISIEPGKNEVWQTDPRFHESLALSIAQDTRPATLYVYTSDSIRSPPRQKSHVDTGYWDGPMEQGLVFPDETDETRPFSCELWGRVLFYVEEGLTR